MNEQRQKLTDERVAEIVARGEALHEAAEALKRELAATEAEAA